MDPRWQHIEQLLDAALDRPPAERTAFLCRACPDDPTLRAEVQHLLDQAERALDEAFLAQPAARHLPHLAQHALALDEPGPANPADPADSEQTQLADPLVGQHLSHFKLLARLGRGGMGVVYRARDTRLGREVALKLLPAALSTAAAAAERFWQEARAASRINHPGICTVHDVGETDDGRLFLAMERLEGRTLRQRLEAEGALAEAEAVRIAQALVAALAAAHARGIVHRDVKPSNVMLGPTGRVTLMDFGVAKLVEGEPVTADGTTVGTAAYMSPEQVRGAAVDARSDLWSVGVVLYEMVTGQRPFRGDRSASVAYAVVHTDPMPVRQVRGEVSEGLAAVIERLLQKEPDRRFQAAKDALTVLQTPAGTSRLRSSAVRSRVWSPARIGLVSLIGVLIGLAALFWWQRPDIEGNAGTDGAVQGPAIPTVAVLPIRTYAETPEATYFADGMTEEFITLLAKLRGLRTIAPRSVMRYRGSNQSAREIAQELAADYIVDGSIRQANGRVRLTLHLMGATADQLVWGETYERNVDQVLGLQRDIALTIAEIIGVDLSAQEQDYLTADAPAVESEAFEQYLWGRHFRSLFTQAGLQQAIEHYRRAIQADSSFSAAYAGLALAYFHHRILRVHDADWRGNARRAAEKALALDSGLAGAHIVLALLKQDEGDWVGAEQTFRRAIALNPGHREAHTEYGWHLLYTGRFEEALAEMKLALELDPLSPHAHLLIREEVAKLYRVWTICLLLPRHWHCTQDIPL